MKENLSQNKKIVSGELPLEKNENKLDSMGIDSLLNKFNPDFNIVCSLVDKLDDDLSEEEKSNLFSELIKYSNKTVETSNLFLSFKRQNLNINNSPLDLFFMNEMHTLKNEVGSIWSHVDLLTEEKEKEKIDEYILRIKRTIPKTIILLDNLKKVSIDGYKVNISEVNLNQSINTVIRDLGLIAKDKGINIKNNSTENVSINTDLDIIESSLLNLVSNAIKFTKQDGNISISINKDNEFVFIKVEDDGVGINKERQKNFFNNLGVTTMGTNNEVGTGVGLYAVSSVLKEINGEISVKSEGEGKGSTFIIKLPV